MYSVLTFFCAAVAGVWSGGPMNGLCRRYAPSGNGETISALPMRILAAITLGFAVISVNFSLEWLIALPFAAALAIVTFCDIRHMIIPDAITVPGIAAAAILRLFIHPNPYWDYVIAALSGSGLFYLAALLIRSISNSDAIGGGDIKLLALTGFVLGIKLSILSFLFFCFSGTVLGILLLLSGRFRNDQTIPFGPYIALASIISYFWGADAISWSVNQLVL